MKKIAKGNCGYIAYEKKKRTLVTAVLFIIPITIFITGYLHTGTRLNLLTVVAVVGCLPACKSMVGAIMMFRQRPGDAALEAEVGKAAGELAPCYELIMTAYEKTTRVDACVICGNEIACYSADAKADADFARKHIAKILNANGYSGVHVKLFKERKAFLERAAYLNKNRDSLRENIRFTPDERYPDLSRDELIRQLLLAISL